ncbi:MAG: hypothetical protein ACRDFQ_03155 [Anaerolineales bacterium]
MATVIRSREFKISILFGLVVATSIACITTAPPPLPTATTSPEPTSISPATATASPAISFAVGETPTAGTFFGQVNVARASCRYGPGGGYRLRVALDKGDEVQVLGPMQLNPNWILVQPIDQGFNCWINTDLVDMLGEMVAPTIADAHIILPMSTYYGPLQGISARRDGNLVRVRWDPIVLREGDKTTDMDYVVETWICLNGEFVFRAFGSETHSLYIRDDEGCPELSHAQVMAVEKNGYTQPAEVPWPR